MGTSNPVVYWEIAGGDYAALRGFYEGIFDWKLSSEEGARYSAVDARDKDDGFGLNGGAGQVRGDGWVAVYVRVKDPQVTLDEVVKRGGKVIRGVTDRPGQATTALFADPEGHVIGLVKA
jgi:predicted enzyme related to lactoylglutathione lyase